MWQTSQSIQFTFPEECLLLGALTGAVCKAERVVVENVRAITLKTHQENKRILHHPITLVMSDNLTQLYTRTITYTKIWTFYVTPYDIPYYTTTKVHPFQVKPVQRQLCQVCLDSVHSRSWIQHTRSTLWLVQALVLCCDEQTSAKRNGETRGRWSKIRFLAEVLYIWPWWPTRDHL